MVAVAVAAASKAVFGVDSAPLFDLSRADFIIDFGSDFTETGSPVEHSRQLAEARLHLGERLFNLGGGWTPTNLDVARLVAEAMSARFGKEIPVVSGALAGQSSPPQLNYQTTRLRGTGFEPSGRVDIELRELLTFCRAHFAARAG